MIAPSLLVLPLLGTLVNCVSLHVSRQNGNATSPYQYGIMFEDINHSGDGGLYAELINNRAFQGNKIYPAVIDPWTAVGKAVLSLQNTSLPLSSALPTSLNISPADKTSKSVIGIMNPGYWGFDVQPQTYEGSFYALGSYNGVFTAKLQSALTDDIFAQIDIEANSSTTAWTKHTFQLTPEQAAPNSNNTFVLEFTPSGSDFTSLNLNLISLFPPTYLDRPNGLRTELAQVLQDLKPTFLRLPGGNNLEGLGVGLEWKWNDTIGDLTTRPGRPGAWGYQNTDGLGLLEYMTWCNDFDIEPILGVFAGYFLNDTFYNATELVPFVQDTMNELEFLMGDNSTTYGAMRVALGFPEPFEIKMVEIGNEDQLGIALPSYSEWRFPMYFEAIKAKYPDMVVIASTKEVWPQPEGARLDYHHYGTPDFLVSMIDYFDNFNRSNPTLLGEFSAIQGNSADLGADVDWDGDFWVWPYWIGAVSEAIYLIGAERNADKIIGATFAPILQNINGFNASTMWSPNLISFTADPTETILSVSYHSFKLFSTNIMTEVLPVDSATSFGPAYWVAGRDSITDSYILKAAVYNATEPVPFSISFPGLSRGEKAELTILTAPDAFSANVYKGENVVKTDVSQLEYGAKGYTFYLPNYSIAVLKTL